MDHSVSKRSRKLKTIGRVIGFIILYLILSIGGCLFLIYYISNAVLCNNQIHQIVYSPDQAYKAVVFDRGCGVLGGPTAEVSVLRSLDPLPSTFGNVLDMEGFPEDAINKIEWTGNRSLSISIFYNTPSEIHKQKTRLKNLLTTIDIDYQASQYP
jgi:hypothetical protein